ncbi:MAG: Ku protein [Deltaproteobacteria bacterium]|nr:Ku protein [Deltaproteobacteria bacterium]
MAARASASGMITFGLVSVPIKLYTATSSKSVGFNMLHDKDKSRLKQQYVCSLCGEVVDRKNTVKGYEHAKDAYVTVTEDEMAALLKKSDQTIDIQEFVPMSEVDPVYFERSQLVGPDKGGGKPYALLVKALTQSGKVAIARYSVRGKEQLVLLRPARDGLMMHALYFHDEVRTFEDIDLGDPKAIRDNELALAVQLVEQLSSPRFDASKYHDDYREQLTAMLERKAAGETVNAAAPEQPREQIIDLMEALKASLAKKQSAAAEAPETKPARKASAG